MMTERFTVVMVLLMTLAGAPVLAEEKAIPEYRPTTLGTCEAFANRQYAVWNPDTFGRIDLDSVSAIEDKFEDQVGSQFISTVVSGTGELTSKDGESSYPIRYVCLLEDDRHALFFHTMDRTTCNEENRHNAEREEDNPDAE
ncbi:MAG: hypothetical protein AB7P76_03910 [Candidatus Melainabacteria bacterium]